MNKINLVLENFLLVLSNSRRFIIVDRTRNKNGTKSIVKQQKLNKYNKKGMRKMYIFCLRGT